MKKKVLIGFLKKTVEKIFLVEVYYVTEEWAKEGAEGNP